MKKLILTIILLLVTGTVANFAETCDSAFQGGKTVWICVSSNSYRYHSARQCHGLCRCSHTIKEVPLEYAIEKKYTPCKICCKN